MVLKNHRRFFFHGFSFVLATVVCVAPGLCAVDDQSDLGTIRAQLWGSFQGLFFIVSSWSLDLRPWDYQMCQRPVFITRWFWSYRGVTLVFSCYTSDVIPKGFFRYYGIKMGLLSVSGVLKNALDLRNLMFQSKYWLVGNVYVITDRFRPSYKAHPASSLRPWFPSGFISH